MDTEEPMGFEQKDYQENDIRQYIGCAEKPPVAVQVSGGKLLDQAHDDTGHNRTQNRIKTA